MNKSKKFEANMYITVNEELTLDEFTDKLLAFIESMDWLMVGGISAADDGWPTWEEE